jgi:hypothetical protein
MRPASFEGFPLRLSASERMGPRGFAALAIIIPRKWRLLMENKTV